MACTPHAMGVLALLIAACGAFAPPRASFRPRTRSVRDYLPRDEYHQKSVFVLNIPPESTEAELAESFVSAGGGSAQAGRSPQH